MQTIFELLFALVLITTWLYVVKKIGEEKPKKNKSTNNK